MADKYLGLNGVEQITTDIKGYTDAKVSSIDNELSAEIATKQDTITGGASTITDTNLTSNRALISDNNGKVATSNVTNTELGYLSGVTSAIQTQLNNKQATITGAASTVVSNNLTANYVVITNSSGKLAVSGTISSTELGYLNNVTSNIQTQLNGKQATLTFDNSPTQNSSNPVKSSGIYTALQAKADTSAIPTAMSDSDIDTIMNAILI